MEIIYLPKAGDDLDFWTGTGNKAILKRIALLTGAIIQGPYQGIGNPEPLKHQLAGKWSRRITGEHRYIYQIDGNTLKIYSLKGHN